MEYIETFCRERCQLRLDFIALKRQSAVEIFQVLCNQVLFGGILLREFIRYFLRDNFTDLRRIPNMPVNA